MTNDYEWRDNPDNPNYEISEYGDVRNKTTGRLLKPCDNNKGYQTVNLYNDGKKTSTFVHRLVAEMYVDGKEDGLVVNHKDGDKHNNHRDNLEWVTYSQNEYHAHKNGLKHGPNRRPIRVNETSEVFESAKACARALNGNDTNILRCIDGKQKSHLGLTFSTANMDDVNVREYDSISSKHTIRKPKSTAIRIIETGEEFPSIGSCARYIGGDQGTISACLSGRHKTHKGYHYEYV